MAIEMREWTRAVVSTVGGALAGPAGVVIGSVVGGLLGSLLPGSADAANKVSSALATKGLEKLGEHLTARLDAQELRRVNHDLQTALRDALLEALYDVGGAACYPQLKGKARDVPPAAVFAHSVGSAYFKDGNPLGEQIKSLFQGLQRDLEAEKILPLESPQAAPAADVRLYLQPQTSGELSQAFYEQVIAPALQPQRALLLEVSELEPHLRRWLLDRSLVHLGELLKERTEAWRAFNRLVLEEMRSELGELQAGQSEICSRLDALLAAGQPELTGWAADMADLLQATGRMEKQMTDRLDSLASRVAAQHAEVIDRLDDLRRTTGRIERKVERVLTFLAEGGYTIEGAPSVALHRPPAPGDCPYKGLQAFTEADADLFFGREAWIARLVERVHQRRFLAVIGASGSGKSSLVRAGLVPVLGGKKALDPQPALPPGSPDWPVFVLTPTDHPLAALASALTRGQKKAAQAARELAHELREDPAALDWAVRQSLGGRSGRALLVLDQFEEVFTLCRDEEERRAFVEALLAAGGPEAQGPLQLVIVLRADFYAECGQYDGLRAALATCQEFIGPMSREELRRAIQLPAERGGWSFETGLVEIILDAVGSEPGGLPLLSHALMETWKRRSGTTMTLESYAETGGVKAAIARTAETLFTQRLDPEQRDIARAIFLRLTNISESSQDSRRRAAISELTPSLAQQPAVERVLGMLVEARLVTTEGESAELAHEALIREWPKLRGWLDDNRAGLLLQRHLTEAALEWQQSERDEGLLYRGARLAEAAEWAEQNGGQMNLLESEFLSASLELRDREILEKEAQRQRELEAAQKLAEAETARAELQTRTARQLRRRAWYLTGALIVAALLAAAAGYLAYRANQATQSANRSALVSLVGRLAAQSQTALSEDYPQLSLILGVEAYRRSQNLRDPQSLAAITALYRAVSATSGEVALHQGSVISALALSPDGKQLATADPDFTLHLWALDQNGKASATKALAGHSNYVFLLTYLPDGRLLSAGRDGLAYLWDTAPSGQTGSPLTVASHDSEIRSLALSPDGSLLATGDAGGLITLRSLKNLDQPELRLAGHQGKVYALAFSPDGRWLASGGVDQTVRLWDLRQPDPAASVQVWLKHTHFVYALAFSPDGRWLASGGEDAAVYLWDLRAADPGQAPLLLKAHQLAVTQMAFSTDGRWLVTAGSDPFAVRWDMRAADIPASGLGLRGHKDWISALKITPDSRWLATVSIDHTGRLWDLNAQDPNLTAAVWRGHDDGILALSFSPDGRWAYTASDDTSVRRWPVGQQDPSPLPVVDRSHSGTLNTLLFTPDGSKLLSGGSDKVAQLRDMATGQSLALPGHQTSIYTAAVSPDGRWYATGDFDGQVRLWDLSEANPADHPRLLSGHSGYLNAVLFTPDSRWLITGGEDSTIRRWDLRAADPNQSVTILKGPVYGVSYLALSADGSRLYNADWSGNILSWDILSAQPTSTQILKEECYGPLALSPDGKWLATGCYEGSVRLMELGKDPAAPVVSTETGLYANAVAFSPDGRWLAAAGDDRTVQLWDLTAQDIHLKRRKLLGHTDSIYQLTYSRDSRWLASGSADSSIRLWDLTAQEPGLGAVVLRAESGRIYTMAFRPGDQQIAAAGDDGIIRIWPLDAAAVAQTACAVAGRSMSQAEWQYIFYDLPYEKTCP